MARLLVAPLLRNRRALPPRARRRALSALPTAAALVLLLLLGCASGCQALASYRGSDAAEVRGDITLPPRDLDAATPAPDLDAATTDNSVAPCSQTCPLDCSDAGVCPRIKPSNTTGVPLPPSCGDIDIVTSMTISTDTCKIGNICDGAKLAQPSAAPSSFACYIHVAKLAVRAAAKLTLRGSLPLIIIAEGDVLISGVIDASASADQPGAGGFDGGNDGQPDGQGPGAGIACSCAESGQGCRDDCGGGGGGFGGAGGAGGNEDSNDCTKCTCVVSCAKGGSYPGADALVPLIGGSGGARGESVDTNAKAAGGGGGGALQISAQGVITVEGAITTG
ncbi:MAG: hypothetical protein KC503_05675, partial [Myxococcales bacterium]|nr:hypothetical protein [Myxococcales bacterium]